MTRPEIEVVPPPPAEEGSPPSDQFTLRVFTDGEFREELSGISFGRNARTVEKTINEQSSYIRVEIPSVAGASLAERLPAPGRYALADPPPQQQAMEPQILEGSETERTGYQGLAIADSVTMVAIPDLITVTTGEDGTLDEARYLAFQAQLADWCTNSRTRMAILDTPPGLNATRALEWRERLAKDTPFATLYYPNVRVPNRAATKGRATGRRAATSSPCRPAATSPASGPGPTRPAASGRPRPTRSCAASPGWRRPSPTASRAS